MVRDSEPGQSSGRMGLYPNRPMGVPTADCNDRADAAEHSANLGAAKDSGIDLRDRAGSKKRILSSPDIEFDAIRAPNFSAQVVTGLIKSSIAFGVFDRWFRFRFVNDTLAKINRIPVRDHMGESIRNITGDMALQAEPILQSVFDTGKVISGFEITGKLPKRPDVGHWIATYFPIRHSRGRIVQVGVLSAEIVSHSHPATLSEREREIVTSLANGRSTKEIASTLGISVKTVESHRARIFFKLKLDSLASLVRFAIRTKMVEP